MNIQNQTDQASDFTEKLAEYIVNANTKTLNKDGEGCWVKSICIGYFMDYTHVSIVFESNGTNVKTFTCSTKIYE